ncbi:hypothetical protein B4U80_14155 [Leptotrombidium deliense]|uniref:Peptidase M13 N-terminal domain-containing protein n=1 Tax=Leptotrombidium deliense TaxID=299467 RepID=A0A443S1I7_9ACAR|nr:hypothetical protein B4U80_14155 [Leptotrombidium deliense]
MVIGIIIIIINVLQTVNCKKSNANACKLAKELEKSVNKSVNACDNFYEFACDRWQAEHKIADDHTSVSLFSLTADFIKGKLIKLLNSTFKTGKASEKLRKLYSECMNIERVNERNSQPITAFINEQNGWPVLLGNEWNEINY